jgi:hypothetical protein
MPKRIKRITDWSNDRSNVIEKSHRHVTNVIPRDPGLSVERYIIFTEGDKLPEATRELISTLDIALSIRAMDDHSITYEDDDTYETATFLAHHE